MAPEFLRRLNGDPAPVVEESKQDTTSTTTPAPEPEKVEEKVEEVVEKEAPKEEKAKEEKPRKIAKGYEDVPEIVSGLKDATKALNDAATQMSQQKEQQQKVPEQAVETFQFTPKEAELLEDLVALEEVYPDKYKGIVERAPAEALDLIAAAERMREPRNLDAVVRTAKINGWPEARREAFDRDTMLLGCPNGTLDLRTGLLRPASRKDLITRLTSIPYDPSSPCPRFMQYLHEMFPDNLGVPAWLQRWFGYCLSGDMRHAVLPVFYGPNGRNGKSILLRVISSIMGEYATTAPSGFLEEPKGSPDPNAASSSIMHIFGRRLLAINELPENAFLDEALAKRITGADTLSGRPPFGKKVIDFRPQAKMVLVTNHKVKIRGVDPAIWDRIKLVTFNTSFLTAEDGRDLGLEDKLMMELPGIFAWVAAGAKSWWNGGDPDLRTPAVIESDSAAYREDEDPLNAFLEARCIDYRTPPPGPRDPLWEGEATKAATPRNDLYKNYAHWAVKNNFKPVWSSKKLKQRMDAAGFESGMVKGTRFWRKITLRDHDLDEFPHD